MRVLKKLLKLHEFLFIAAILFTFLSIVLNLCWNRFLAETLDSFNDVALFYFENRIHMLFTVLTTGIFIIFLYTISEFLSSYPASYTCEIFAHEMRMGYVRHYLQCDIQTLSKLNVGEEQSAMQNELKEISDYLNTNLFP